MNARLHHVFFTVTFLILGASTSAQKSKLVIEINKDRLQLIDTIDFVATYLLGEKQLPPATLALVMKENHGDGIWQMRWPMVNGRTEATLVLPKEIKKGNYTLYFAVQARFFGLFGKVLYPPGIKNLNAVVSVPNFVPKQFNLTVEKDGSFKIEKFLFENSAVLELDIPLKKKMPAITMDAWLDSTFEPAAAISKEIIIGMDENASMENIKVDNWIAYFDPFYQTTILGNMPASKKFDSVYVPSIFKKNIIQQFDCLGDSSLVKSPGLESFLQKYFPGFEIDEAYSSNLVTLAHSSRYKFVFYLDGQPVTYATLNNIKLSDIATIKILPPNSNLDSAFQKADRVIISLFSKQGPFCTQDYYRYEYIINGYQPAFYQLPTSPKMFASSPYYLY